MAAHEIKTREPEAARAETTRSGDFQRPLVDIFETDQSVVLYADMPGVGKDDLEISVDKDELTLLGRVKSEPAGAGVYAEYRLRDYFRAFELANVIRVEKIEAELANGVLKLTLPKADHVKSRKIAVRGE